KEVTESKIVRISNPTAAQEQLYESWLLVPWGQKPGLVKLLLRGRRIRDANDLGLCHLFRSEYDRNGSQLFRSGARDFKARPGFRLFDPGCKTVQLDAIPVHCDQLVVYVEALVISRRAFRNPDNDNPSLDGFCVDPQIPFRGFPFRACELEAGVIEVAGKLHFYLSVGVAIEDFTQRRAGYLL